MSIEYKYRRNLALEIQSGGIENSQTDDGWYDAERNFFSVRSCNCSNHFARVFDFFSVFLVHFISVWTDCKND